MPKARGMEIFKYEEAKISQKLGSLSHSRMVSEDSFTSEKATTLY